MKTRNVTKIYKTGENNVIALNNISIELPEKGMIFITGKSGSGKSTLLHILGGLIEPTSGSIEYRYHHEDNTHRLHSGLIFQDYNLFDHLSVFENLKLVYDIYDSHHNFERDVDDLLAKFDLAKLKHQLVRNLSGGEKQRIAILRALIKNPDFILADEPTGNLDSENAQIVNDTLKRMAKDILVIYVTHDNETAVKYGDGQILLSDGKIVSYSTISNDLQSNESVDVKVKKAKLSTKYTMRFARRFLFLHKTRFLISIVSFIMSILLFCVSLSLWKYDTTRTIHKYIYDYDVVDYSLSEEKSYENIFETVYTSKIRNGATHYDKLLNLFDDSKLVRFKKDMSSPDLIQLFNVYFIRSFQELQFDSDHIQGTRPVADHQILISDYVAISNQLEINDQIHLLGSTLTITGIIETDFQESNYLAKKNYGNMSPNDIYQETYYYKAIFVNDNIIDIYQQSLSHIVIDNNILMEIPTLNYNLTSSIHVAPIAEHPVLKYGNLPVKKNEILVTEAYANELNLITNDQFVPKTFHFFNFTNEDYHGVYDDVLNLYDYFPNGVNIIGVIDSGFDLEIYINESLYDDLSQSYFDYFYIDEFRVLNTSILSMNNVKEIQEMNLIIDEPNIAVIGQFSNFLLQFNLIITILVIILLLLSIFLLSSLFLNSYINSKRDIAILLTFGLKQKEIIKICFFESIIVSLFTISLLLLSYLALTYGINQYFYAIYPIRKMDIYLFDMSAFTLSIIMTILFSVLSLSMTLQKTRKWNPLELLKIE